MTGDNTQAADIEHTAREIAEAALASIARALEDLRAARLALLTPMMPTPEEGTWRWGIVVNVEACAAKLAETAGYLGLRAAGLTVTPRVPGAPLTEPVE